jgi:hypothetical protein
VFETLVAVNRAVASGDKRMPPRSLRLQAVPR